MIIIVTNKVVSTGNVPDFAIGLEGGVSVSKTNEMECFAWIAVYNGNIHITLKRISTTLNSALGCR